MATTSGYFTGLMGGAMSGSGLASGANQQMQQQQWNNCTSQYLMGLPYPLVTPINKLEIGEQPKLKGEKLCLCSRHLWS